MNMVSWIAWFGTVCVVVVVACCVGSWGGVAGWLCWFWLGEVCGCCLRTYGTWLTHNKNNIAKGCAQSIEVSRCVSLNLLLSLWETLESKRSLTLLNSRVAWCVTLFICVAVHLTVHTVYHSGATKQEVVLETCAHNHAIRSVLTCTMSRQAPHIRHHDDINYSSFEPRSENLICEHCPAYVHSKQTGPQTKNRY
jgi:hypothetical protein